MTQISYRSGVDIAEIIVYVPSFFLGLLLAFRHGFSKSSGWIFIVIFATVRTVGAAISIAAASDPSVGLITAGIILSSIGLTPLILASIGLLIRTNTTVARETASEPPVSPLTFRAVQLPTIIGLILSIVGSTNNSDLSQVPIENKVGIVLITCAFVVMVFIALYLLIKSHGAGTSDQRLAVAVLLASPLILCRLVFSLLVSFANSSQFTLLGVSNLSITTQLCMAVIEEFIVIVIYIGTGLTLKAVPRELHEPVEEQLRGEHFMGGMKESQPVEGPPAMGRRFQGNSAPRRQERRRGGPITMLIHAISDEIEKKRDA